MIECFNKSYNLAVSKNLVRVHPTISPSTTAKTNSSVNTKGTVTYKSNAKNLGISGQEPSSFGSKLSQAVSKLGNILGFTSDKGSDKKNLDKKVRIFTGAVEILLIVVIIILIYMYIRIR
ncbi:hypothetical protein DICVIV_02136 [Dictyocaulus viviparus]|uniref:Uncharacterized protein n=1 Tax=Dictyocaulus viviparus TaxID=29172 RepID=A0A0D8Y4S2_DICVI|nr:hypothetical protein DICVIV_02136 [Dictyocaulus viviparus]